MSRDVAARRRLSVYLVHYEAPEWCKASVRSLPASEGIDLDLTIVDNGGTRALDSDELSQLDVSILETGANVGFPRAVDLAFADWLGGTGLALLEP